MLITNTALNRFHFYIWTNIVELRVNTGEHGNSAAGSESESDMTFLCFAEIVNLIVGILLYKKNVLIFDDVMTSSNTLQAAFQQVEKYHPKQIKALVLACPHIDYFKK